MLFGHDNATQQTRRATNSISEYCVGGLVIIVVVVVAVVVVVVVFVAS